MEQERLPMTTTYCIWPSTSKAQSSLGGSGELSLFCLPGPQSHSFTNDWRDLLVVVFLQLCLVFPHPEIVESVMCDLRKMIRPLSIAFTKKPYLSQCWVFVNANNHQHEAQNTPHPSGNGMGAWKQMQREEWSRNAFQ